MSNEPEKKAPPSALDDKKSNEMNTPGKPQTTTAATAAATSEEKPASVPCAQEETKQTKNNDSNAVGPDEEKSTPTERAAVEKQPRDPDGSSTNSVEPTSKRSRTTAEENDDEEEEPTETVDLAVQLGFKNGDRLQVEWELVDPDAEDNNGEEQMTTRWWGCTLLPHDGRTEDTVAIRTLDYDPYPQGGFPERSQEDVIFLSHEILISPETHAEFRYRPEGVIQFNNEEETRGAINEILMDAMKKHAGTWNTLTPAQQASIAEGIAQKKEQLVEAIMSHDKSPIIGPDDMQEILAGIMR